MTIRGIYPLYEGTSERIGRNNTQYIDSEAPQFVPGGGTMSITQMTLNALYELHNKARNWWTKSNCKLPLIKYMGCKLKLYRSENSDYVFLYMRCGDLRATEQLYQSITPSVLLLNKHRKVVLCKQNNPTRKQYKTVKIKPPTLMYNKWYFQQDLANIPLVMWAASAASLGRYYISANSISSTIGFTSLNTDSFKYHNFKNYPKTTGYKPNDQHYFYGIRQHQSFDQATYQDLIFLGNTADYQLGTPISAVHTTWQTACMTWGTTPRHWGNPFHPSYFSNEQVGIIISTKTVTQVMEEAQNKQHQKLKDNGFTLKATENTWNCRYNPQNDRSHNTAFFTGVTNQNNPWGPPTDIKLTTEGLPLWLLLHGEVDWQHKQNYAQRIDTEYCIVLISDYIVPKKSFYVILDTDFEHGRSPFFTEDGHLTVYDQQNFFPKLNFQERTIAKIVASGPGQVKLPSQISTEAHVHYSFYFKLGGCPPPMDDVCDPSKQPKYPNPGNFLLSNVLQSPETPMQYYLYSFDQRRQMLTDKAAKRIKSDWTTKDTSLQPTGTSLTEVPAYRTDTSSSETETSEEEKDTQTLQQQLKHQRRKQRQYKRRIKQLLRSMAI